MMPPSPTKKALAGLAVSLGLFGALEAVARTVFADQLVAAEAPPPPPMDGAPTLRGNPYLLWEQAPGLRVEHGIPAHINRLGLRGPEPEVPKPPGVRRLLATGDSSVYGFRVHDDEVFITVAARLLGGEETQIEGWNAAIPGYSTYQTLNMLEMRALALEPDVLVVANLWSDNNFDSFVDRELLDAYSTFEDTGTARLQRALRASAFYRLLHYRINVLQGSAAQARKVGWTVGDGTQIGRRRVEVNDYAANLERLVQLARARDAQIVFVVLANEDDLKGPRTEPAAWTLYRQVMQDTAARHGAPVVDVPTLFYKSGLGRGELFIDEMHPTATGHRLIAEALAEVLGPWAESGATLLEPDPGAAPPTYQDTFTFGDGGRGGSAPPTPGGEGPARDRAETTFTLTGDLVLAQMQGTRLQIDAVALGGPQPQVLRAALLTQPGPFLMEVPRVEGPVGFLVYDDLTGNGPSADDRRFDLTGATVTLEQLDSGVRIDVDQRSVSPR